MRIFILYKIKYRFINLQKLLILNYINIKFNIDCNLINYKY